MALIKVGIIGVSGLVGKAIIDSIIRLNLLDVIDLHLFGTSEKTLIINSVEYKINVYDTSIFEKFNLEYCILAVDNKSAREICEYVLDNKINVKIIDNSSEYRLNDDVPLCVPEINFDSIELKHSIIANPNCSTTILVMLLKPLLNIAQIKKIIVSTYQAASGAGYKGLEELELQTKQYSGGESLTMDFWKKQYVYNVFSHNSTINKDNLFNEEELKMVNETKKILNINPKITPTCVRVPTLRAHCLSVHVEFYIDLNKNQILNELNKMPGINIYDFPDENKFPEPVIAELMTDVYVGRIRPDLNDDSCWNFFLAGDQLLKGAGYNSVQILKKMLKI